MREIRQSGSEGGGNEQTVSPYPYLALRFATCISGFPAFAENDGKKKCGPCL